MLTIHQCPKCELRFNYRTELDDHLWHDHPQFRHDYPAVAVPPEQPEPEPTPQETPSPPHRDHIPLGDSLLRWVVPDKPHR